MATKFQLKLHHYVVNYMYYILLKYKWQTETNDILDCRWPGKLSVISTADADQMMDGTTWWRS
jgi:hypothetical protein